MFGVYEGFIIFGVDWRLLGLVILGVTFVRFGNFRI